MLSTLSSYGINDFYTYLAAVIAVILLPGPNSMYCLYVASSRGVIESYKVVSAIMIGDTLLMLAATLGAATLLKTSPMLFSVFKGLGGLYLLYLGCTLLLGAVKSLSHKLEEQVNDSNTQENTVIDELISAPNVAVKKEENVFLKAFLLSMSNPKAIIFFISIFLQFVNPNYDNTALSFFILGMVLQIISFLYLSMLIFMGTRLVKFFESKKYLIFAGNACVGLLFMGFAVSLWQSNI